MRGYRITEKPIAHLFFIFLFFSYHNLYFSFPDTINREKKMRGGRHTGCLVLSHTLAVLPVPPGTRNTRPQNSHTHLYRLGIIFGGPKNAFKFLSLILFAFEYLKSKI